MSVVNWMQYMYKKYIYYAFFFVKNLPKKYLARGPQWGFSLSLIPLGFFNLFFTTHFLYCTNKEHLFVDVCCVFKAVQKVHLLCFFFVENLPKKYLAQGPHWQWGFSLLYPLGSSTYFSQHTFYTAQTKNTCLLMSVVSLKQYQKHIYYAFFS